MQRVTVTMIIAITSAIASTSTLALPVTFTDDFNRPDGIVGNGWLPMLNNINGDLVIRNGALTTPYPTGYAGIYRAIDYSAPVTISATLTHQNGYGGLTNRYESGFLLGTSGSLSSGYQVMFHRSDSISYNSSVAVYANGVGQNQTKIAQINSPFQFGTSITPTITYAPTDGRISGTVADGARTFNFDFGSIASTPAGSNIGLNLEFPDSRLGPIIHPTFDNLSIRYTQSSPLPPRTVALPPATPSQELSSSVRASEAFRTQQLTPSNRLTIYRGGVLSENVPPSPAYIDPQANTYVLIHGWNGPDSYGTSPSQDSFNSDKLEWVRNAANAILQRDSSANVVIWNWTRYADSLSPDTLKDLSDCVSVERNSTGCEIVPTHQVRLQADHLARDLRQLLAKQRGVTTIEGAPVQIQIIGHSLGAAIGANAVRNLVQDSAPLPITRLTLFDAPENESAQSIGGRVNLDTVLPGIRKSSPGVAIESYFASGLGGGNASYDWFAYGSPYEKAANTFLNGYTHSGALYTPAPYDWYTPTIHPATGTAGTRGINEDRERLEERVGQIWTNKDISDEYKLSRMDSQIYLSGGVVRSLGLIYDFAAPVQEASIASVEKVASVSKGFLNYAQELGSSLVVGPGASYLPYSQQTSNSTPAYFNGPWSAEGKAEVIEGLGLRLTTQSPAYAFTHIFVPVWADAMLLDFRPEVWSDDDLYAILFDDQIIFALMGSEFIDDWMNTGFLDIARWAGRDVLLTIGFLSDLADHSVVTSSISFYRRDFRQVPEPNTVFLLGFGLYLLFGHRRKARLLRRS